MPAPFYNAIKGTTAGTPGTGAFTPNAASSGFRAWSIVPTGWIGMVRFEDGSAWELSWCYWNGTTLSRSANQLFDSSSGSAISLTSAATAAMIVQASDVMSNLGTTKFAAWSATTGSTALAAVGCSAVAALGTASSPGLAATNYLTEQLRVQWASATTANSMGGGSTGAIAVVDTTAGRGGFEFIARFGAAQLPTSPRLFLGLTSVTWASTSVEPSALTSAHIAAFAKDSTDTNIQLLTKDGTTAHKVDTGIPWAANGWYEASVWIEPGSNKVYGLLIRLDTGDIWFGSSTTNPPATGSLMLVNALGALNGTNTGTALNMCMGNMSLRAGQ